MELTHNDKESILWGACESARDEGMRFERRSFGSRSVGHCCAVGALTLDAWGYCDAQDLLGMEFTNCVWRGFDGHSENIYPSEHRAFELGVALGKEYLSE